MMDPLAISHFARTTIKLRPRAGGESDVLFPSRFSSSFVAKAEARCAIVESRGKRVVPVKSSSFQKKGSARWWVGPYSFHYPGQVRRVRLPLSQTGRRCHARISAG